MNVKQKIVIFAVLASISAASVAPIAATTSIKPIFIVLPLLCMGIFLFIAGYYAGLNKNTK